ncbi:MAG: hypothetical protein HYR56_31390 [Acidobacteria bacterium]|nr:hypothetical protein [Acidobacteriota bacterium]MBI3427544.1 hypothetical protein [Acidobacteriota bacterium]
MLDSLHYDDFVPHLKSKFQLRAGHQTWEAELVEVTDKSPSPKQEQFALQFRAPLDAPPVQTLFEIEHASLGTGGMFLVPVHRDAHALYYEAIFNRPRS